MLAMEESNHASSLVEKIKPPVIIVTYIIYIASKKRQSWSVEPPNVELEYPNLERCPDFRGEIMHISIALGQNKVP